LITSATHTELEREGRVGRGCTEVRATGSLLGGALVGDAGVPEWGPQPLAGAHAVGDHGVGGGQSAGLAILNPELLGLCCVLGLLRVEDVRDVAGRAGDNVRRDGPRDRERVRRHGLGGQRDLGLGLGDDVLHLLLLLASGHRAREERVRSVVEREARCSAGVLGHAGRGEGGDGRESRGWERVRDVVVEEFVAHDLLQRRALLGDRRENLSDEALGAVRDLHAFGEGVIVLLDALVRGLYAVRFEWRLADEESIPERRDESGQPSAKVQSTS